VATVNEEMIKPLLEEKTLILMACKTSMEMNNIKA
jgi:hypothetical protein